MAARHGDVNLLDDDSRHYLSRARRVSGKSLGGGSLVGSSRVVSDHLWWDKAGLMGSEPCGHGWWTCGCQLVSAIFSHRLNDPWLNPRMTTMQRANHLGLEVKGHRD